MPSSVSCCQPLGAPTLTDGEAEATAGLFKAIGDPARVKIINLLANADQAVCACDFVHPLGLSQPTVSHHLSKLLDVGLVTREQRGKWAFFSLNRDVLRTLAAVVDLKGVFCR